MGSPRDLLVAAVCLSIACGGSSNPTPDAGGGPQRVSIEPATAAAVTAKLASADQALASESSMHALAARAAAAALRAGAPATPVTFTANGLAPASADRAALTSGAAKAYAFQVVIRNAPQPIPTLSGVVVLTSSGEVAVAAGPSQQSTIPPAVGVLFDPSGNLWAADGQDVSAQLDRERTACTGVAIPGVTCLEADFLNAHLNITGSHPINEGATGSRSASLPAQSLVGVSLTVDCALTQLCDSGSSSGPVSLFFAADDGVHGVELWATDGTPEGTRLVKDINPTGPSNPIGFTELNGITYFAADDGVHGKELWRTDGTPGRTSMVKDINTGFNGSVPLGSIPQGFAVYGGEIYFAAQTVNEGRELWKSDGTAGGTVLLMDIVPGSVSASPGIGHVYAGWLYFGANQNLWRTDGTAAHTELVLDKDGSPVQGGGNFIEFGGLMYFTASTQATGGELWRTDGTPAGTFLFKDIVPGPTSSRPVNCTVVGTTMFFNALDPATGEELWKTDGTPGGTVLVKDLYAGTGSSSPNYLTALNDKVFFACFNPGGSRLCVSDGTLDHTGPLLAGPNPKLTAFIATVGDHLIFEGSDDAGGAEPWISDGTAAGTVRLMDIEPGTGASGPERFTVRNGKAFFSAHTSVTGTELWVTDGTPAGTILLKDILPGPGNGFYYF